MLAPQTSEAGTNPHDLELVSQAHALRFDRREPGSTSAWLAKFLELLDPEIEIETDAGDPGARRHRGPEEARKLLAGCSEQWETFRTELQELLDLGGGRVLASGRAFATCENGRVKVGVPFASVWTLRGGKAVGIESYRDRTEASAALRAGDHRGREASSAPRFRASPSAGADAAAAPIGG
jgi:ketosteroid isomerase-like protein